MDTDKCALNTCETDSSMDESSLCTSSTWCIERERTDEEKSDCLGCGCPTLSGEPSEGSSDNNGLLSEGTTTDLSFRQSLKGYDPRQSFI